MILTSKQVLMLYQHLIDTANIAGGLYDIDTKYKLINQIMKQQSEELVEFGKLLKKDD